MKLSLKQICSHSHFGLQMFPVNLILNSLLLSYKCRLTLLSGHEGEREGEEEVMKYPNSLTHLTSTNPFF